MAKQYVVTKREPGFSIEPYDPDGSYYADTISQPTNFTEAKKVLKTQLKDTIARLKAQLKGVGAMRKDG